MGMHFMEAFVCRPWINVQTGELQHLIRAETENDYLVLTIDQVLLYLEELVPWSA